MPTSDELFRSAADAVKRKKFSQAVSYFEQILEADPEYIDARKGLRAVAKAGGGENKFMAMISGSPILAKIQFAKSKKNFAEGIKLCEQYLQKDPGNAWVMHAEALFASELKYVKTASFCYENLAEMKPDNVDQVIEAADFLSDMGTPEGFEKANSIMNSLANRYPDDIDIRSDQSRIAAKKTLGHYEKAKTTKDILMDTKKAADLEDESQEIRTDEDLDKAIKRAEERMQKEPDSSRHTETLADLYTRKGKFRDAIDMLTRAIELDQNNENTKTKLGDVKMKVVTLQLANMEERLKEADEAEKRQLQDKIKAGRQKLKDLKLQEFTRRLRVNPNDMRTHYELGQMMFLGKEYEKAIQHFQKSVADARLSFMASKQLGMCFKAKAIYDLAISTFQEAMKKPSATAINRLEVQYEMGICYMESGKKDDALAIFNNILEKDYGYKDVAQRVAELQGKK